MVAAIEKKSVAITKEQKHQKLKSIGFALTILMHSRWQMELRSSIFPQCVHLLGALAASQTMTFLAPSSIVLPFCRLTTMAAVGITGFGPQAVPYTISGSHGTISSFTINCRLSIRHGTWSPTTLELPSSNL
jgi:hypothetical protein